MAGTHSVDARETDGQSLGQRVVAAIAAEEETAPLELETPLFDAIDPEALNSLFTGRDTTGEVSFTYYGYRVTVCNGEPVRLSALDD